MTNHIFYCLSEDDGVSTSKDTNKRRTSIVNQTPDQMTKMRTLPTEFPKAPVQEEKAVMAGYGPYAFQELVTLSKQFF